MKTISCYYITKMNNKLFDRYFLTEDLKMINWLVSKIYKPQEGSSDFISDINPNSYSEYVSVSHTPFSKQNYDVSPEYDNNSFTRSWTNRTNSEYNSESSYWNGSEYTPQTDSLWTENDYSHGNNDHIITDGELNTLFTATD